MAAPTNTFLSTAAIGNRESLHDIIKILEAVTGFLVFSDVLWSSLDLNSPVISGILHILFRWMVFAQVCRRLLTRCLPGQGTALEPMRRPPWRRSRNDLSIG